MATADDRRQWRDNILDGVEKITIFGVPGLQVVCGAKAEPILTGRSAKEVLISAAEYGQGRIVVFSHDEYVRKWFLQNDVSGYDLKIFRNILSWVTKGKYVGKWNVVRLTKTALKNAKPDGTVLIWQGSDPQDAELIEGSTKFVSEGGSIIVGITPWGSMQIHRCDVDGLPCYHFLKQFGIFLTDGYFDSQGSELAVVKSHTNKVHVGDFLLKCKRGEQKICELDPGIIAEMVSIPDRDCDNLFKGLLDSVDVMNMCKPPSETRPVEADEDRAAALFINLVLKKSKMKAPGVDDFPGDFAIPPPLSCLTYKIESCCDEAHPVGAYLAPGGTAVIDVLEGNPADWEVQVGCHSDNLGACDKFKRWPDIVLRRNLEPQGTTSIQSPFGGSIYFISPAGKSNLSVRLKDIVESPLFKFDDKPEDWEANRIKPGLWGDFVGRHIMITVPSETIRETDHPAEIMEFWDEVVMAHHDLKGDSLHNKRKQWLVPDIQPTVGYMHSGWPVVTHMDAADPTNDMFLIRKPVEVVDGHWGYFHELGHNMQEGAWTFDGTVEVTCNIFSLHAMQKLFGIPAWEHPWLQNQKGAMKQYLKKGANFTEWKEHPGVALGIYAQLARDFGFATYKKVFRKYNEENPNLETDQEKIDHWIRTFSKAADSNLVPAFNSWGIPVSRSVNLELIGLKAYLPKDEVTGAHCILF